MSNPAPRRPPTATRRKRRPTSALVALALAGAAGCDPARPLESTALGDPLPGLSEAARGRFLLGRALFERIATAEEGLGPLFNAERCSSCHDQPATGGGGVAVPVLKATAHVDGTCSLLRDLGGDNIQQRVTAAASAGGAEVVPQEATASVRVMAPPLFGLGLLESVAEEDIARSADPDDANGDGISGRMARDAEGRWMPFGRKGDASSIQDFVEQALLFELGFTSPRFPREESRNGVSLEAGMDLTADPEMTPEAVALLAEYVRFLASPAPMVPEGPTAEASERGSATFDEVGCARCHTADLRTGPAEETSLSGRLISPYTDLLLHDMGYGEGDVCTPQASPGEYRTAPLWGLRHRHAFLFDGRATTVDEAIRAHGGEAAAIVQRYADLSEDTREDLLAFLGTL